MSNPDLGFFPLLDGDVSESALRSFLADQVPESQILEYKAVIEAKKAVKTVAAFANKNGGYLLLGVPEVKRGLRTIPGEPAGLDPSRESAFRSHCLDVLDPPWAPDIEACHLASGGVVLIVRVTPMPEYRPVLIEGQVWTREGDQTRGASRETARLLFSEVETATQRGENPANLAGQHGPPLAPHLTKGEWLAVRGIATVPTPVGSRPVIVDHELRRRVFARIEDGPAAGWLTEESNAWGCELEPWKHAGESSSARFEIGRTAGWPTDHLFGSCVRVTFGVGSSLHRPPGIYCFVDLAKSSGNREAARALAETGSRPARPKGETISFPALVEMVATALGQADVIVGALVAEFPEPRPQSESVAASLHGHVSKLVDFRGQGIFTKDVDEITKNGWPLVEPAWQCRPGQLDTRAATESLIDRFLLDAGQVEKLPLS